MNSDHTPRPVKCDSCKELKASVVDCPECEELSQKTIPNRKKLQFMLNILTLTSHSLTTEIVKQLLGLTMMMKITKQIQRMKAEMKIVKQLMMK